MFRLDQTEIIRAQSCRVSVRKLKVFDDQNGLDYHHERDSTRGGRCDATDPDKFDHPDKSADPDQVKKTEAKPSGLFKDSSLGRTSTSSKQTGGPKSRVQKIQPLKPEIKNKPLEEEIEPCLFELKSPTKAMEKSGLETEGESIRNSLEKITKEIMSPEEIDSEDSSLVSEIPVGQNGDSKSSDLRNSFSSLIKEAEKNRPSSPSDFKDSLSDWKIESEKKIKSKQKKAKKNGSETSSVKSYTSMPDSFDYIAMIDKIIMNDPKLKIYPAQVRLKRVNVEREHDNLRIKRIKLDAEIIVSDDDDEPKRPIISPTKISSLLSPTKISPDFFNALYKNADWMKNAKDNKVQMFFPAPNSKVIIQGRSGLKVRIPLKAKTVKEVLTPRGYEFYVNQKKPVLKLHQVDEKGNFKLKKSAYNKRSKAENNPWTVIRKTTPPEPVESPIKPFDYFKRGHFLAELFGLRFEEDQPPPPPPTIGGTISLPTVPLPPQNASQEYDVIRGTGGHIIGYKLKKNTEKQVALSSGRIISLASNFGSPEQQNSTNLLQARLLAPNQALPNASQATIPGNQVFRLPNGQIFSIQINQEVKQQSDPGIGGDKHDSESDSEVEDLSSFLTPQMSMDVEDNKAIDAAALCRHVPDPEPGSILGPEVIDIDEDEDGDGVDPLETRQPSLPPVNNNKPARFCVVSGPHGPTLMPKPNPVPVQQPRFLRAALVVPPVLQQPQPHRTMPRIISMAPRILTPRPTLIVRPPPPTAVLSNTPVTRQVFRPSHSVLSNRPPPPLTAQRPVITNSPSNPVILKTFTMTGGVQVAACPFCGLVFKRENINEHILQQHNLKPKSIGVTKRGPPQLFNSTPPMSLLKPQLQAAVPDNQKLNGTVVKLPVLQKVAPRGPTLVIPSRPNVFSSSNLQKPQNLSSDEDDDIVELDPLDLGEDDGRLGNNYSDSTSGALSNTLSNKSDVTCSSDPLAFIEDFDGTTTSSAPSTSKSSTVSSSQMPTKKTVPMFPCPFCPDKAMFSSANLHEHIQKSHHHQQKEEQIIASDPLEEFF